MAHAIGTEESHIRPAKSVAVPGMHHMSFSKMQVDAIMATPDGEASLSSLA